MKKLTPLLVAALLAALLIPCLPAAESADYRFDYTIVSEGGAAGTSTDYETVDTVKLTGLEDAPQESADYSVAPVYDVTDDVSSVQYWMLY